MPSNGGGVELLRLTSSDGEDLGPLPLRAGERGGERAGVRAGVPVLRQVAGAPQIEPVVLPGPVKILAAVAAPDESRTGNAPLDAEAEMQAVLDAVTGIAGDPRAQVQILEVASVPQLVAALKADAYHVLHLCAHGSAEMVELEDEDGGAVPVGAAALIDALRAAGRPVPLIVLSAGSGRAAGAEALAAGLIRRGAGRVIALPAPIHHVDHVHDVDHVHVTELAASFYRELVGDPAQPVGQILARARRDIEQRRSAAHQRATQQQATQQQATQQQATQQQAPAQRLEHDAVPTLFAAHADAPLVAPTAPTTPDQPLTRMAVVPSGTSVHELAVGALIGRRLQLRATTALLRRTPAARDRWGTIAGAQLIGVGGIGKTAIAGRVMTRLRTDGWAVAVHEGRWDPTALISAVAGALTAIPPLADLAAQLGDPALDDVPKLGLIRQVLSSRRLLLIFDDFEQNLTRPGGEQFLDPAVQETLTALCGSAQAGGVLVTSRYPVPGLADRLVEIPVPALSPSELGRLLLRLPALRDLDADDRLVLHRTIGGHPRLIEFVDALLRGGRADLRHVQAKLRDLAHREGIDIAQPRPLDQAVTQAMVLGGADILLDDLLGLLTPRQRALLDRIAVSRAPMHLADLATTRIDGSPPASVPAPGALDDLAADVERLTDLTLLTTGPGISMHSWTAELLDRRAPDRTAQQRMASRPERDIPGGIEGARVRFVAGEDVTGATRNQGTPRSGLIGGLLRRWRSRRG